MYRYKNYALRRRFVYFFFVVWAGSILSIRFKIISLELRHLFAHVVPVKQPWRMWVQGRRVSNKRNDSTHQNNVQHNRAHFVWNILHCLMTLSYGNIFRVTGPLRIPLTKASDAVLRCFLDLRLNKRLGKNNREAGDLKRHRAHYDVTVWKPSSRC